MACNIYTKKLNDFYSNYFEDTWDFETAQDHFTYLVNKLRHLKEELSDISEDEFRSVLQEGYDNSLQGDTDLIKSKNELIGYIKTHFEAESQNFFTEGNMLLLFRDSVNNIPVTEDNAENNNEKTLTISLEDALDLGKEFLFTYFKDSADMQDDFEKIAKSYLVKTFLVDYENERIVDKNKLNDQIRDTQQYLVNQIIDYLMQLDGKSQKGIWIDFGEKTIRISKLTNFDVFNQDKSSTGLYEALLPLIKLHLNVQGMSTSMLNSIHVNKYKEKVYYNAVMAVTLLNNFNNYLKSVLGEKNIDIQNVHQKLNFGDNYFFSEKGDGNITTYRVDENIDVVKETNSITKLIFETVPYYTFDSDEPIPGQYLNFPQASRVIADLKSLSKNTFFKSTRVMDSIKSKDEKGQYIHLNRLSSDTQEVLMESDIKSVADILAKVRHNPQKYFSAVLELLCDSKINTDLLKVNLNQHVQNIMYSMYRTLFSNNHNSLRRLSQNHHRLYPQITQFVDTVYKVELVQYNTNEDGITQAFLLAENEVNNQKNYLKQSIYQFNAKSTGSYTVHQNQYKIQEHLSKESKFSHISFEIPNTKYIVQVDKAGTVKIFQDGKQIKSKDLDMTKENKFRWFIEDILHVQIGPIGHDSEFFKALKSIKKTTHADTTGATQMNNMFEMAAKVLLYQHINVNVSDSRPLSEFILDDACPETHRIFKDEIMMISGADFMGIVPLMAEAMCIVNGNVTASQVKNGEGKAQGLTTLSRLMNSKNSQWLLQNKRNDSAVKEFSLYDLIEDVYVTVEKHDLNSTKPVNKFSISEGIYSQFILDFIGGLVDHSTDRNVFGNGNVGILSSVNSDKNTVAKLVLNLSKREVSWRDAKGKLKSAKLISNNKINITNEEFIELINYELGNYYYKHMKNVQSDWFTLLSYLGIAVNPKDSIHTLLNKFNDLYITDHLANESQLEYLSRVVAEYNLNSGNFLEFIDQIHYIETKEGFSFNRTTESLLCRFKPTAAAEFDLDTSAYLTSSEFWQEQDFNLFKSLFESDFQLKLINTKNVRNAKNLDEGKKGTVGSLEHDYLLADSDWVKKSTKEFIYAKIYIPGETTTVLNITSSLTANRAARKIRNYLFTKNKEEQFFINEQRVQDFNTLTINDMLRLTTVDGKPIVTFELNNKLRQYNYLDYLFSQEYLISTVGSHVAHPDKNKIDIANNNKLDVLSEESARFNAQHKRNVSQTATMKEFQLNDIFGVAVDMNVAVVKDIIDFQNTVNGDTDRIKPYDGACIVNPFMVLLENYSLGADAAGYVKKPFFHAYKERFGTGIIIKTAGFGITNDNLRNLEGTKILMKKMTNRRWRNQDGSVITEYNVFDVKLDKSSFEKGGTSYDQIFYMKDGVVYNRKLEWISGMTYKVTDYQLNENGEEVGKNEYEMIIDTNYKLWNAFGGEYSCHFDSNKGKYIYDESSIEAVVELMNATGYVINPKGEIRYQDDFYQPLKHADIHYLATEGAIKQGASNINSAKVYNTSTLESDEYDDLSLAYMKVKLYQAGIQLDKEHHADKAELSLMTQVISACALKGYTITEALHLYQALASIGEAQLSEFYNIVKDYVTLDANASQDEKLELTDKIRGLLYDTLLSTLSKQEVDLNNIASAMAYKIIQKYRNNKNMGLDEKQLPLSDTTMFKKLVSNLAVYLSNKGIKVKVQGILAVLNPSYDLFKLHNGRKLEEFTDSKSYVATEGLQKSWMSEFKGELNPSVTYNTVEIRANAKSEFYLQLEQDANGSFNLYQSLNTVAPTILEQNEMLIGVAQYLPVGSVISSFVEEYELFRLLELGFKKDGERILPDGKKVPILKKVKSLPKQLLLEQLNSENVYTRNSEGSKSLVRLGTSYYITREIINAQGQSEFTVTKENIITIGDYKKLSKDNSVLQIRHNYTDGQNLAAYNNIYKAKSPEGKEVTLSLYDSDAIYWQNLFKQIVRKCPASSKKLQDFLKFRFQLDKTKFDRVGFVNRIINGESFKNEMNYFTQILEFFEADSKFFGGFYFQGKNIEDFIINNQYVNISALNTFILARLSRIAQHNLSALSETRERIEDQFTQDYNTYINPDTSDANRNKIYNYWKRYIVGVLKQNDNLKLTPEQVFTLMQQYITNTTSVLVNGVLYKVDPDSVIIQAHQCVMPKTMATKFGLETYDNLSTVKNDIGFFYKRFKSKYQRLLTNDKDFTLELKRLNGDHVYLINQEDYSQTKLTQKDDVYFNYIDGKLWRVDSLGNRIHQVSSEEDKIYVNEATGVEIIKTDNFTFYLDNLHYQNIEISRASTWDTVTGELTTPPGSEQRIDEIIESIRESSNKIAKRVYNYYTNIETDEDSDDEITYQQIAQGNLERSSIDEQFTTKSDDEVIQDYINGNRDYIPKFVQKMIKTTLEIHSSFLMSLNILAARIPAQCMQSFMAMEVVAFNNSDTSNAYVATSQIYLQGSDFDIDAVSLETFSFDSNGRFYDWSPYFDLSSYKKLKQSLKIPFPTFQKVRLEEKVDDTIIKNLIANGFITVNETTKKVKLNTKDIKSLIQVLNITKLPTSISIFKDNTLNKLVLDRLQNLIDNHNMYFNNKSVKQIEGASANYAMLNSFNIAADPVNQIQAMTSVDSTTRPMKEEGNKSKKAKALANRGPGNWVNKIEAINENAVGKDCIAICATGIKVFTAATFTNNYILNSVPELQQFLPFEVKSERDENGEKINVTKKLLANIKAKNPNTVTNEEVYELLLSVNDDVDAALVLSALLSLSTDNAKELQLSKLNATAEMIGMYIYGISIGMDFRDLAKALMSDTGELIMKLRSADSFNDTPIFYNFYSIFEHLEMDPNLQAYSYRVNGIRSPKSFLDEFLQEEAKNLYKNSEDETKKMTLVEYLFRHKGVTENGVTRAFDVYDLKDKLTSKVYGIAANIVESSENTITSSDLASFKIMWNQMFDYLADWHRQHKSVSGYAFIKEEGQNMYINSSIFKALDPEVQEKYKKYINFDYLRIKRLAEGASEMKIAGQMLGINKGFKSTIDDIISLQSVISKAFNDRGQWKTLKQNLYQFTSHLQQPAQDPFKKSYAKKYKNSRILSELVFDETKKISIIEEYDKIKHTFNLPLILTTQPNYHEYYKALVTTDVLLSNGSFLYKALTELVTELSQDLKIYSSNEISNIRKGVEKYVMHKIINNFLNTDRNNSGGQLQFEIPSNSSYVSSTGTSVINKGGALQLQTGNDASNYSFKMFMEQVVIPRLQKGELTPNAHNVFLEFNPFISNLVPIINDKTYTKVPTMQMTSNINLLPTNPEEDVLFKQHREAFKEISQHMFSSGDVHENSIADLFFIYDLFVNNNNLSQNSFKKFFVSPVETISQLQLNFYNYVKDLDKTIKTTSQLVESIFNVKSLSETYPELLPYILRPYSGNTEFANSPYLITQESDGSVNVKAKTELSNEDLQLLKSMGLEVSQTSYDNIDQNRQWNPFTFYGMKVTSDYTGATYKPLGSKKAIKYFYRVASTKNGISVVEIDFNGKVYSLEVKTDPKNNKLDMSPVIGLIEEIINPC